VYARTLYFGLRCDFSISAFFAISSHWPFSAFTSSWP
jgi:hypothetical protein